MISVFVVKDGDTVAPTWDPSEGRVDCSLLRGHLLRDQILSWLKPRALTVEGNKERASAVSDSGDGHG